MTEKKDDAELLEEADATMREATSIMGQVLAAIHEALQKLDAENKRLRKAMPEACVCCHDDPPVVDGRCKSCPPDCQCWNDE